MPDINPIHSEEDIKEDTSSTESNSIQDTTPHPEMNDSNLSGETAGQTSGGSAWSQDPIQVADSAPEAPVENGAPVSESTKSAENNVYPTPLTLEERDTKNGIIAAKKSTPVSVMVVALLGTVASFYGLYSLVKVYFFSSLLDLSFFSGTGGLLGDWAWLVFAFGLFQYAVMLFACYKIWHGSMGGLGFLTGISFTFVYGFLISLPYFFKSMTEIPINDLLIYLLYVAFYVALTVVWIKDRRYFN